MEVVKCKLCQDTKEVTMVKIQENKTDILIQDSRVVKCPNCDQLKDK